MQLSLTAMRLLASRTFNMQTATEQHFPRPAAQVAISDPFNTLLLLQFPSEW